MGKVDMCIIYSRSSRSTTTGIATYLPLPLIAAKAVVEAVGPLQQGLRLALVAASRNDSTVEAVGPLQQGLRPEGFP